VRLRVPALGLGLVLGACALRPPAPDINHATPKQLATVPGITREDAERIVAGRPYFSKDDLVRRQVLTPEQYSRAAEHLSIGPPGEPDYLEKGLAPPLP